ncbi:hypothetical protein [Novosphingobium sp.]|uniref:hypothetical protein n=1 Tax=Novosphingobium sp. TaxID=1874826 RepID=UPI0026395824|nr:hypothetical protein [Novosphingobium sp.]
MGRTECIIWPDFGVDTVFASSAVDVIGIAGTITACHRQAGLASNAELTSVFPGRVMVSS